MSADSGAGSFIPDGRIVLVASRLAWRAAGATRPHVKATGAVLEDAALREAVEKPSSLWPPWCGWLGAPGILSSEGGPAMRPGPGPRPNRRTLTPYSVANHGHVEQVSGSVRELPEFLGLTLHGQSKPERRSAFVCGLSGMVRCGRRRRPWWNRVPPFAGPRVASSSSSSAQKLYGRRFTFLTGAAARSARSDTSLGAT